MDLESGAAMIGCALTMFMCAYLQFMCALTMFKSGLTTFMSGLIEFMSDPWTSVKKMDIYSPRFGVSFFFRASFSLRLEPSA